MFARLAIEDDENKIVELAEMQVAETIPHLGFSEFVARATFQQYLDTANPTIFVVEDNREIIGYLVALVHDYAFTNGHFANQEVIYVIPRKRGSRAATHLIKLFNQWADRIGSREVFMGVANGFKMERTAKFMQHFGFDHVGAHLRRIRGA